MSYLVFEAMTALSKKETIEKLQNSLTEFNWFGWPKDSRPFYGTVVGSNFKITRVVLFRDFFNLIMYGHIWSKDRHTHVSVRMAFHPVIWAGLVIYSILISSGLVNAILDHASKYITSFSLMLLFPWLVGIPLSYYNVFKSKKLLQERLRLIEVPKNGG